ncbi:MAG: hypothetical protein WA228_09380, partial [Desulfobaccales bacterium]
LQGQCDLKEFDKWLDRKANSHIRRDRNRGNTNAKREEYKIAILEAVNRSKGNDAYTGKIMRWDLISKYDNDQSKSKGREYKKKFGDLPTVDHVDDGRGSPQFNICSWRVNDAKNDLTLDEFIAVCKDILGFLS